MRVDGTCHCGAIRFEAEVDPERVVICHCTDCQTLTGTAFRTVVASLPGSFRLLAGVPRVYVKTGASGNRRELGFCPDCGTPIYSAPEGEGVRVLALRIGALAQRDRLVPREQYWCRSAQGWLGDLASIPCRETQPVFDAQGGFGER